LPLNKGVNPSAARTSPDGKNAHPANAAITKAITNHRSFMEEFPLITLD